MTFSVAVLGATGLVGRECVQLLLREPAFTRVTALSRRPVPPTSGDDKLQHAVIDFDDLDKSRDVFAASHVFCALGTTIKQAGSQERFREVDLGYPTHAAELALAAGARHFLLVSSLGASADARTFYLRVKGELEQRIIGLGFRSVTIVRPSLLLGDRAEFRLGEQVASRFAWAFPRKYRAVHVRDVARALVGAAVEDRAGVRVIENAEILA